MAERFLALVLHDVSPATWPAYRDFLDEVDALSRRTGPIPITWLVVPEWHHGNDCRRDRAFRNRLDARLAAGDELALHGYYHSDDGPPPRTPREYFMRRIYTVEGEFQVLGESEALARLDAGIAMFEDFGWPLAGFVAPAWLMSPGTRRALARRPLLRYTSGPRHLYQLPDFTPVHAPGLVWSSRSAWRRGMSRLVSAARRRRHRSASLLRLGVHPIDMRYPGARHYWLQTLAELIAEGRRPITSRDWLALQAD
jgi:predicted deacetylase